MMYAERRETTRQARTTTAALADSLAVELFNAHTYGHLWFADKHENQIALQASRSYYYL